MPLFNFNTHQARIYARHPSLTERLPWLDYSDEDQCLLLSDGVSVGTAFALTPRPCEARPADYLKQLAAQLNRVLTQAIPHDQQAPWILQCYVQDQGNCIAFFELSFKEMFSVFSCYQWKLKRVIDMLLKIICLFTVF